MAHHHLAFQLPEGVERHAHDDDDRSSAERDVHLGDTADADRQDGHERQEDTADQRDLGDDPRDEVGGRTGPDGCRGWCPSCS